MTMTEKYKILGKFIKDLSSETPDIETYLFVRDRISSYQLNIDMENLNQKIYKCDFGTEDKKIRIQY